MPDIDDPKKGIEFCNRHIVKIERHVAEIESLMETVNDEGAKVKLGTLIAKYEGHLVKWTEELEHFIHQAYQQGLTKTDVTVKKGR